MLRRTAMLFSSAIAAIAMSAGLSACGGSHDPAPVVAPPAPTKDIVQLAQDTPALSILVEAVVAAGLAPTLKGPGPFTVFAPTDAAFAALLTELGVTKAQLLADKALLTKVLTYHVLPGKVERAAVTNGAKPVTVQGQTITLNVAGSAISIADGRGRSSNVTTTDVQATNGVVHLIDKVILPQRDIVETAVATSDFSILVEAVVAADLATALSGPGPFTVFAPTNAAFAALLTELGVTKAQLLADKALLTKVLTYHVVSGRVPASTVTNGLVATSLQGGKFTLNVAGGRVSITDGRARVANVVATDVAASNGIIHVIDKVILPQRNIVETAISNPDFSILVEAVVAADLAGTLSGAGPFTVFAPTNAAFAALLTELGVTKAQLLADKPLLTKVLTYHVLAGRVPSSAVTNGLVATSVQGGRFTLNVAAGRVSITDARGRTANVVAVDVDTSNGVIHVLDKVILPQ
jgi:transforming growth factor-beta-induced protein